MEGFSCFFLMTVVSLFSTPGQASSNLPVFTSHWGYGPSNAVAINGDVGYFASGAEVLVTDISDPRNLEVLGTIAVPGRISDLSVQGDLLAVAAVMGGLRLIDVSTPELPVEVGHRDAVSFVTGVLLDGDMVYIGDYDYDAQTSVHVIDITDPTNPTIRGSVYASANQKFIRGPGPYLFSTGDWEPINAIDISDPDTPVVVGTSSSPMQSTDLSLQGSTLYASGQALFILDASDPANLALVNYFADPVITNCRGIAISGSTAYMACPDAGPVVLDVSNPTNISVTGVFDEIWETMDIAVRGATVFTAAGLFARSIDVSVPAEPVEMDNLDFPGITEETVVQDNLAFVATAYKGLRVVDVSNRSRPVEIGSLPTDWGCRGVVANENFVYLAADKAGLRIVDISEPTKPSEVSLLDLPGTAFQVARSGHLILVAAWDSGLRIVDVSDPKNPVEIGALAFLNPIRDVAVSGTWAYVLEKDEGLSVVDFSDPANPVVVDSLVFGGDPEAISIDGRFAYVGSEDPSVGASFDVGIYDISNPLNVQRVGFIPGVEVWSGVFGVTVSGGCAFLSEAEKGIRIVDVSDPRNPVEIGSVMAPGTALHTTVAGQYLYESLQETGMAIYFNPLVFRNGFEYGDTSDWTFSD